MSLIDNIKKRGAKDILNPKKWGAYIDGEIIEKNGIHLEYNEIIPFCQQLMMRLIRCSECVEAGKCVGCGCIMPLAAIVPNNFCSEEKWKEMVPPEDWEKYMKEKGMRFKAMMSPEDWKKYIEETEIKFGIEYE